MFSGIDDPGESRMGEISMSGSTREREAAVIGLWAFHSVLSSLLYWFSLLAMPAFTSSALVELWFDQGCCTLGADFGWVLWVFVELDPSWNSLIVYL